MITVASQRLMAVLGGPNSKPNSDVAVSMDTWTGKITQFWNQLMQSQTHVVMWKQRYRFIWFWSYKLEANFKFHFNFFEGCGKNKAVIATGIYKNGCKAFYQGLVYGVLTIIGMTISSLCAIHLLLLAVLWQFGDRVIEKEDILSNYPPNYHND